MSAEGRYAVLRDLSGNDVGRTVELVANGVLIVGSIAGLHHRAPYSDIGEGSTMLHLKGDAGWSFHKSLPWNETVTIHAAVAS